MLWFSFVLQPHGLVLHIPLHQALWKRGNVVHVHSLQGMTHQEQV